MTREFLNVAAVYDRRTSLAFPVAIDRRATMPSSVVAVAGPATEFHPKRSESVRIHVPTPVILSLSKDQLPEGVHLYRSVCTYRGLILRQAQDDRVSKPKPSPNFVNSVIPSKGGLA